MNDPDELLDLSDGMSVMRQLDEAIRLYDQVIAMVPSYYDAWLYARAANIEISMSSMVRTISV